MIKLFKYFEKDKRYNLIKFNDFSYVIHKQSIGQANVQVFLSSNLLVFVLTGKKIIHTDSGDITIDSGDAFFAEKGSYLISEKLNQNNKFESLLFFVDDTFIKEFTNKHINLITTQNIDSWKKPDIYKIKASLLLRASVESILPYFTEDFSNKKELLKLKFEELFFHLINVETDKKFLSFLKASQLKSKIDIIHFMNENFTLPLTVQEFAKHSSRSLTSFKGEFKHIYDQTPKQWINQKRLEYAHKLLNTTDKNVTEVSFDVGFENVSHFIQLFKKRYGTTPKKIFHSSKVDK